MIAYVLWFGISEGGWRVASYFEAAFSELQDWWLSDKIPFVTHHPTRVFKICTNGEKRAMCRTELLFGLAELMFWSLTLDIASLSFFQFVCLSVCLSLSLSLSLSDLACLQVLWLCRDWDRCNGTGLPCLNSSWHKLEHSFDHPSDHCSDRFLLIPPPPPLPHPAHPRLCLRGDKCNTSQRLVIAR